MGPVRSVAFSGSDMLFCGDDGNNLKTFVSALCLSRSLFCMWFASVAVECIQRAQGQTPTRAEIPKVLLSVLPLLRAVLRVANPSQRLAYRTCLGYA